MLRKIIELTTSKEEEDPNGCFSSASFPICRTVATDTWLDHIDSCEEIESVSDHQRDNQSDLDHLSHSEIVSYQWIVRLNCTPVDIGI